LDVFFIFAISLVNDFFLVITPLTTGKNPIAMQLATRKHESP
jgi:hypothetical protein